MRKPNLSWRGAISGAAVAGVMLAAETACAQLPGAAPASEGMSWQVAALFTANWVLVAVAVAMMSRPSKRSEKPKKPVEEQSE
jgi:hypothetical protein